MTEKSYEYDIAFSLLARDESVATELNDALSESYKTFIYPERQRELAGTDGEKTFSELFQRKARLVVVLFRNEWGTTPWTRIEQTAIRNRAFDQAYEDFAFFIAMDASIVRPDWVPRRILWFGLEQFKIDRAIGAIDARLQEVGGEPTAAPTLIDHARKFTQRKTFDDARDRFRGSFEGVSAARIAFTKVCDQLLAKMEDLRATGIDIRGGPTHGWFEFWCDDLITFVDWRTLYGNVIGKDGLSVDVWNGRPPNRNGMSFDAKRVVRWTATYDLLGIDRSGWLFGSAGRQAEYDDERFADEILRRFLEALHKQRTARSRSHV